MVELNGETRTIMGKGLGEPGGTATSIKRQLDAYRVYGANGARCFTK